MIDQKVQELLDKLEKTKDAGIMFALLDQIATLVPEMIAELQCLRDIVANLGNEEGCNA